jgi:ATP-binding cassette subfamily F protein 3
MLFMLATYHAPHVLVMDEPTNHLDIDSREALIMAINDYEGAVVLISHDRHIIETSVDRLWLVKDGTVSVFDGDMDDYTDLVLGRKPAPKKIETPNTPKAPKVSPQLVRKKSAELIAKIDVLRGKLDVLDGALADHTIYKEQPKKAADFAKLRAKFATELDAAETEWLELQETENA